MTLYELLQFCKEHDVEFTIGYNHLADSVKVELRKGMYWQIDYDVTRPEELPTKEIWEFMMIDRITAMAGEIERQKEKELADLNLKKRMVEVQENQDAQFQRYSNDMRQPNLRFVPATKYFL